MGQKKTLRTLQKILEKVKQNKERMQGLTKEQLQHLTVEFKERLSAGESLDDILPEAYAAICEADYRVLGKRPYDVQVLGAIAMHQGKLIEMNTGEGKTLVATMPLYLNALTGKSTILLTTNEYLALRDAKEMGEVYRFMGLSVAAGVQERSEVFFTNEEKKAVYASDIVYTTHGVFGFDYLLNNLVTAASERFLRELYYVIIDEADSVLLDSSQTPLVISGAPRVQSNLYALADFFVTTLVEEKDYKTEENKVWLTKEGVRYAEQFFRIDNFYGETYFEINRHVTLALRAHVIFKIEKDYMISKDGELQLLDNGSGRMMPGVKLRGGQHQAIEVKEGLEASMENRSVASITYQNLFLLFEKMSGMSGTISDAAEEIKSVYGTEVIVIPPNCTMQRHDLEDYYFKNREEQLEAAMQMIIRTYKTGQPILIVVSTIAETEIVSALLMEEQIPHSVLNANNAFWEAEIIKEAGQKNTVTVATAMAGRGTDICLGEGVRELGGLAVIGIGRMANVRQERQARGRAGRQGDPGFTRFYVSLEDEIVRQNGSVKAEKYIRSRKNIRRSQLKSIINAAQRTGEEFAVLSRGRAMEYDQVMQRQRRLIYQTRNRLLDGGELEIQSVLKIAQEIIREFLESTKKLELKDVRRFILDNLSYCLDEEPGKLPVQEKEAFFQYLTGLVVRGLEKQKERIGSEEQMKDFMRIATLHAVDEAWIEQVDYLQQLQYAVSGRSLAQRNPLYEYQKDALASFRKMEKTIQKNMIRNILLSDVQLVKGQRLQILFP